MKIAFLIPSTSKDRNWNIPQETYLYKITLDSFRKTYDSGHIYTFYIGIDRLDKIYDNNDFISFFNHFIEHYFDNCSIKFIYMDNIPKGYLSKMWNKLFKLAYLENNDYFFQCGDDIKFITKGWINDSISILNKNNNIGLTGPMNDNLTILTQTFVHRKHMDIFGFYFPDEIINWCIDDWINLIYKETAYFPLNNHLCINLGGSPRYLINNKYTIDELYSCNRGIKHFSYDDFTQLKNIKLINLVKRDRLIFKEYLLKN